jgi:hypothetical protein
VNSTFSSFVPILIAAGMICVCMAMYVWPHRRNHSETIPLVLLLLGITKWIAATLAGMLDPTLSHKMLWGRIEHFGVVSVPLPVQVYVLPHSGSQRELTARRLAGAALIPAWTNGSRGFNWARHLPLRHDQKETGRL